MLIRSQNKEVLIDMKGLTIKVVTEEPFRHESIYPYIETYGTNSGDFSETLGTYSTKEKAIKVLDMIQEAYANSKVTELLIPEIGKMVKKAMATEENIAFAESIGVSLAKKMLFQMPEDSEVE